MLRRSAILLVVSFSIAGWLLPEPPEQTTLTWESLQEPGSIIKRFVDPLTKQEQRPIRSVLTSDEEHASSIAPVLSPNRPVFIRATRKRSPEAQDLNFVLEDGRVFINYENPYEAEKLPPLKIRPVDGKTRIPFLVRTYLTLTPSSVDSGSLDILIRLPLIFDPKIEVHSVIQGTRKMQFELKTGPDIDNFTLSVPLGVGDISSFRDSGKPMEIMIDGLITLADYQILPAERFNPENTLPENKLRSVSKLVPGRDYLGPEERSQIEAIAAEIAGVTQDRYQQLVLVHRFVSTKISYFQNNMLRTGIQVLSEGIGDCDDFSRLMVCLLRALGIPARTGIGFLYDFNSMGAHAWVETALPLRNGKTHWFICDPTLASASQDRDYFVQFKNRIYLYPVRFEVKAHNLPVEQTTEVLFNWSSKDKAEKVGAPALHATLNTFNGQLRASLDQKAALLRQNNLLLTRQFLFTPGSSFIVTEKPVVPKQTQLRTILDNDERLVVDLSVLDDDFALDTPADQQTAQVMRNAYQRLKQVPFEGSEARYCLELMYYRDRYTDRLQRVSLKVGRYLVEQHLKTILESFQKEGLLDAVEVQKMNSLYHTCAGKNLYYLQELARAQAASVQNQVPEGPKTPAAIPENHEPISELRRPD